MYVTVSWVVSLYICDTMNILQQEELAILYNFWGYELNTNLANFSLFIFWFNLDDSTANAVLIDWLVMLDTDWLLSGWLALVVDVIMAVDPCKKC